MEQSFYKEVYTGGQGEIVEKKSRFIANVRHVESEEEAVSFINEMKKKYWDARHNCSAFVIGKNQELQRCSDDGEPSQTAGRPMLDVLLREGIHNTVIVVTRYFGGTLLGTGGLVRAYQKASQEGLLHSVMIDKYQGQKLVVDTDYTNSGKIQYLAAQANITIVDTIYTDKVQFCMMVPQEQRKMLEKKIIEETSASASISWGEPVEYAVMGEKKELLLFPK